MQLTENILMKYHQREPRFSDYITIIRIISIVTQCYTLFLIVGNTFQEIELLGTHRLFYTVRPVLCQDARCAMLPGKFLKRQHKQLSLIQNFKFNKQIKSDNQKNKF